ncbi:MAG TPA: plasmid pRiA4b ORF-3 family protein [Limnochordia bacterium]|nr:plasmid pRiA4b ORF-3 family protein [Limnochordia bacterium]
MQAYQLKVEMTELPTIWRRVIVPGQISFEVLHYVVQYAMGWHDAHLYEFSTDDDPTCFTNSHEGIDEYEYLRENPHLVQDNWDKQVLEQPQKLASAMKIDSVLQRAKSLNYLYDFGDSWQLRITLEDAIKDYADSFPVCIAGKEPAPPEDVGGTHGYMDFLEAWYNPSHEEHNSVVIWGRSMGFTGAFDLENVNRFLRWKLPLGRGRLAELGRELNQDLLLFETPCVFNLELSDEKAAETNLLKHFLGFLRLLDERGPVKATAKGNLPAKLVMELFSQDYDYLYAPHRVRSVRKEEDAWFISELHHLGRASGLIAKRKGEIGLTKKGQKFLDAPASENYFALLQDYVYAYNMGYEKEYEPLPAFLIRYLLLLLEKYGGQERDIEFYSNRLINIYPLLLHPDEPEERIRRQFGYSLFRLMEQFLAEFGLVEPRRVRVQDERVYEQLVKKTDLFGEVFITW